MAIQFVNNVDFNLNQAQSIVIEKLGSDPASDLVVGRIIFNTASDTLKQYVADTGSGSPGWVEVGGGVESVGLSMPSAFTVSNSPVTSTGTLTVVGAGATSQYIDGTGALQTFPTIPTVPSNIVETIDTTNGTYINLTPTTATDGDVTITADLNAVDGTAVAGERYLTKTNKWATVASIPGTYTWTVAGDAGSEAVVSGDTITFAGGTNITTEYTAGTNTLDIDLDDSITLAGTLTVNGTGQSSFGGQVTVPTTPSAATDAASKSYVLSQVGGVGGFQGGYNATTNTPALTGASNVALNQGDFYVVTTAGTFFTENVEVGDFIFANSTINANSSPSLSDYTVVIADQNVAGEGATDGATQKGVAGFNSAHFNVTANGFVSSDIYAGGSTLGIVPAGGAGTTFLRGDGTWVTPTDNDAKYALTAAAKSGSNVPLTLTGSDGGATTTVNLTEGSNITLTRNSSGQITIASTDTGALGDRVALTGGSQAGGLTTFTYDVTNSFTGANAIDVKCEVISAAGETVYASVTRSGANLIVEFTGSISDSAYEVLLTYVG